MRTVKSEERGISITQLSISSIQTTYNTKNTILQPIANSTHRDIFHGITMKE